MSSVPRRIRSVFCDAFGHDHRGDQIHFHPAVLFRYEDGGQPQFCRFAQYGRGNTRLLMLD